MSKRKQTTLLENFSVTAKKLRNSTENENVSEQAANDDRAGASTVSLDMILTLLPQQGPPKPESSSAGEDAMAGAHGSDLPQG